MIYTINIYQLISNRIYFEQNDSLSVGYEINYSNTFFQEWLNPEHNLTQLQLPNPASAINILFLNCLRSILYVANIFKRRRLLSKANVIIVVSYHQKNTGNWILMYLRFGIWHQHSRDSENNSVGMVRLTLITFFY